VNNKILEHAVDALVRTGPRAIGAFVRAWLWTLFTASIVATAFIQYGLDHMPLTVNSVLGVLIMTCVAMTLLAIPAAIVVVIVYVALKF
jgi:hypothetical protein